MNQGLLIHNPRAGQQTAEWLACLPVHLDGTPEKGLWPLDIECHKGAISIFRK